MKIYIDENFKCFPSRQAGLREVESSFFDNKCEEFILGYQYIPEEEMYVREDGKIFKGSLAFPWKPYKELDSAQRLYEHTQYLASIEKDEQYTQAYAEGVNEA